jgi:hypothetical protein
LLAAIAEENLDMDRIDAYKAFTQGDVDATIYVEMATGFTVPSYVLQLKKALALEGIRQGAHIWFKKNRAALTSLDFIPSTNEPNLYTHKEVRIIIGVFADDILVGYHPSCAGQYLRIKAAYAKLITISDPTVIPPAVFTGIEITRDRNAGTLTISQGAYLTKVYEAHKASIGEIPYGSRAVRDSFDKLAPAAEGDRVNSIEYLRLCGAIVWPASMTRPDIQYAVSILCSFSQCAGPAHMRAALTVIGYLHKTNDLGITYGGIRGIPLGLVEQPPQYAIRRVLRSSCVPRLLLGQTALRVGRIRGHVRRRCIGLESAQA